MNSLAIVLLTYNRFDYAVASIRSTLDNLHFTGKLSVHIADDGSDGDYIDRLMQIIGGYAGIDISSSNSKHSGYGANYNLAMQSVHPYNDFVLPLEDDWILTKPFHINSIIDALNQRRFGCVRLGYLGYTQPLHGEMIWVANHHYFLIDSTTPEPHVFAGHPRIETVEWARSVGPWPEGLDPNLTEFTVAHYPNSRKGVVWPADIVHPSGDLFAHIGAVRAR
jgi:hypothetical protein